MTATNRGGATPRRLAVVGSGASGLAAAFHLQRSGHAVDLIEAGDRLGGRFGVARLGERPVMMGGKNIGRRYTSFRGFTAALGRHPYEPFGINASRVQDGRVSTLDSTRFGRSARFILEAGRPRDLLRLAHLALRTRRDEANKFLGGPYFVALSHRADHVPLSAHFGEDVARHLLRPMTVRMNGAEPDEVYLGTFGTNIALLMDSYDQLRSGIEPVLDAISERVTVRLRERAVGLVVRDGQVQGLRVAPHGADPLERDYDGVVLAAPAHAAADVLRSEVPAMSSRLDEVRYFPSTVVLVEYDRPIFTPDVRALAMPDGPCTNVGAYGMRDRHVARFTFSGRDGRERPSPELLEDWLAAAEERLARHAGTGEQARRVWSISHHWSAAYCAYLPFHGRFLADVRGAVAEMPGLELAGDYLRGASIEACFRSGTDAAVALTVQLANTGAERPRRSAADLPLAVP